MKVYFERRDWWVGVYFSDTNVYICPLPMLVIRFERRDMNKGPSMLSILLGVSFGSVWTYVLFC